MDESKLRHAQDLRQEFDRLYSEGNYRAAIPLAERTCTILEEELGNASQELATCLNDLSSILREQRAYGEAEPLLERALAIYQETLGSEHPNVATVLNNLALLYKEQGEYAKAEQLYQRVLLIREKALGPMHPDFATALNNLGVLHAQQGKYGRAAPLLEQALAIRREALGPEHLDTANSQGSLAWLYSEQGDLEQALSLYEQALAVRERILGPDHPYVANSLNNLAALYRERGEHGRAEPLHARALSIRERVLGPRHPDVAISLYNLAGIYFEQGEYEKAEPLHARALAITEATLGPEHLEITFYLTGLAAVHRAQGEYEKAKPCLERALSIRQKILGPNHVDVAEALTSLARVYLDQGEYPSAEPLLERALYIVEESLDPEHPHLAYSLNDLAVLYMEQGGYDKAEPLLKRALSIGEKALGFEHPGVAVSLRNLGRLYVTLGRHGSALKLYRRALDIEEKNLTRALVVAEDSRRLSYASRLFVSVNYILSLGLQVAPHSQSIAQLALTALLRRKSRIQDLVMQSYAMLRRSLPIRHQQLFDDLASVQSEYAALAHRGADEGTPETHRQRLVALERKQDAAWSEFAKLSPRARILTEPITILDVQSSIPSDAVLIEYVDYRNMFEAGTSKEAYERYYAAYIVFSHRFDWVDLGPATAIDEKVRSFREAILGKRNARPASHALYDSIMKPVVDRLDATHRLFIAPDGNLNLVPFDALVDEYDKYLLERFHLHYLTSGRDLLRPWMLEPVADGPVVVVANPTGVDLPGTEEESTLLASLFSDVVTMQHEDASEARLRTHEQPRILHLATHGTLGAGRPGHTVLDIPIDDQLFRSGSSVFDGLPPTQLDNPMLYSWLDLARPGDPPDDSSTKGALDDGKLTAYEVSGWDLRGTELVTLSACDTAQGQYQQGEGILGLRRAFAVAGVQTQVMSLWKVSDTSTAKLMASYYRRLLAGEGRSEAMHNTRLELLHEPETRHPRDWAAFVVVGEWGPLSSITSPVEAELDPIDPRPRGCQATVGYSSDPNATTLLLLPLFALTRRRRLKTEAP